MNSMTSLGSMSLSAGPRQGGATSTGFPSAAPMGGVGGAGMGTMSNGFGPGMGFPSAGMNMGMRPAGPAAPIYGGMATTTSTPNFSALAQNQPGKPPDLSALDSLFTPQKPKVTLNQITPVPQPAPSPWLNQFGSQQPAQAAPLPMGGAHGGFGMQANPFFSPQNFSQATAAPMAAPPMNTAALRQSASANNDLKDLFG